MTDYLQPDFYRFNSDSLKLITFIQAQNLSPQSLLDMGAGSGILGIELARHFDVSHLTLLELQKDFRELLEKNSHTFLSRGTETEILIQSFEDFHPGKKFDLIVSNPPYYLPGHGQESLDKRRMLARSFIQDGPKVLLKKMKEALAPKGRAYIVLKNDEKILKVYREQLEKEGWIEYPQGDLMILELFHLNVD